MAKGKKIVVINKGPYLVCGKVPLARERVIDDEDGNPLRWKKEKDFQLQESYFLCRCGQSSNKPFCDGTHAKKGFDGRETASRKKHSQQCKKLNGPGMILADAPLLCSGAGFCHRKGGTWALTEDSDNPESKDEAIRQACYCPSGRLIAIDKGKEIEPGFNKSIGLVEHSDKTMGPIRVKGKIPVESVDGKMYEARNRMTLCRCGRSKNKPFCDASHLD